jgi:hypothetical protein
VIRTNLHPLKNAARWKEANATNCYIALGQTSAWEDDSHPPTEDPTQVDVNQKFIALKATIKWIVRNDSTGSIPFTGTDGIQHMYSESTTLTALITSNSPIVLVTAQITGAQLATVFGSAPTWRQLGVYTDLAAVSGHQSDAFLAPSNITSWGQMETLENRGPLTLSVDSTFYTVSTAIPYGTANLI